LNNRSAGRIRLGNRRFTIISRLPSRRNRVFLVEDEGGRRLIVKNHLQQNLKTERCLLEKLGQKKVRVPEISEVHSDCLVLEFIEGINLCELLESCELTGNIAGWRAAAHALALWFCSFYRAFESPTLREDINLRNFILSDGHVFGVDFEGVLPGRPESDIGRMMAFTLCYDPPFTPFKKLAAGALLEIFEDHLNLCRAKTLEAMSLELEAIRARRGLDIPEYIFNLSFGGKPNA
jgi:hypothetical protein